MRGEIFANSIGICKKTGLVTAIDTCEQPESLNTVPELIMSVERRPDGTFVSCLGDPRHGGCQTWRGRTMVDVIGFLHPVIVEAYQIAFSPKFDLAGVREFFPGYVIVQVA